MKGNAGSDHTQAQSHTAVNASVSEGLTLGQFDSRASGPIY